MHFKQMVFVVLSLAFLQCWSKKITNPFKERQEFTGEFIIFKSPEILAYLRTNTVTHNVIFFGTNWCKHSKGFRPTFKALAADKAVYTAPIQFIYYEIGRDVLADSFHKLFRVTGFPSLVVTIGGKYWSFEGERTAAEIQAWLRAVVAGQWKEGKAFSLDGGHLLPGESLLADLADILEDGYFKYKGHLLKQPLMTLTATLLVILSFGSVSYLFWMLVVESWGTEDAKARLTGQAMVDKKNK